MAIKNLEDQNNLKSSIVVSRKRSVVSAKDNRPSSSASRMSKLKTEKVRAFYVAGIGASAGGLEALKHFFKNLQRDSGIAYVVIPHLAPDHKSIMVELLQKHSKLPVVEAVDKTKVKPDYVYVLPPGMEISISQGALQLMPPIMNKDKYHPIDQFFRSLAQDQGSFSIGIVLSGTGTDGSQGIREIKNESGLVIVQESTDALYTGMPLSAVETGVADFVLPAKKIPEILTNYVRQSLNTRVNTNQTVSKEVEDTLKKIFVLIRSQAGLDFSLYKRDHLIRGINKQMSMHRIDTMEDYVRFLRVNNDEVLRLSRALLVKVTRFFRDEFAFEALKKKAFPIITKGKNKKTALRIWVPGCSTGEEAYSLAILLREFMEEKQERFAVQIFATDVDNNLIEHARAGIYPAGVADDISDERLSRFFEKSGTDLKIKDDIRSMIIFAVQDLVKGPTFMRLDLISCRNLLIYMGQPLQKKIIPLFHYCLNPGGILFLGSSETIGSFGDLYSTLENKARLFQARRVKSPALPRSMREIQIPESAHTGYESLEEDTAGSLLDRALANHPGGKVIATALRDTLASLKVNKKDKQPKSKSEKDAAQYEREIFELRERLQTTIEELETSNEELRSSNEELESVNEELLTLNAEFQNKIDELADARANMDIILAGAQIATIFLGTNLAIRSFTPSITGIINLIMSDIGRNLRDFATYLEYPNMISDIEEVLQTGKAKEIAVRHENGKWYLVRILPHRKKGRLDGSAISFIDISDQKKIEKSYKDSLAYAEGVIETVREPFLILDRNFRVITGNYAFYRIFKVSKKDTEKKLIFELGNRQWDIPELRRLLEDVLPGKSQFNNFKVEHDFETIGHRKMLLNARQIMQEGEEVQMILLALEDITNKKLGR